MSVTVMPPVIVIVMSSVSGVYRRWPHGQRVAGGRLEVGVVASLTVIAPVPGVDGERQVAVLVPVGVAGGRSTRVRPSSSPVVGTVTTASELAAVSAKVRRGVRDGRCDVGDRDGDDLGVGGRAVGGLDREVVAGGRLEVEVVRVVDGDGAGGGADGERQVAVAVPSVLPAVIDQVRLSSSPVVETVTTAALLAALSARLAAVSVTVGATSVIVMVMTSVSAVVPSVAGP